MTETSSDRSHLTPEQEALSIVVASSPTPDVLLLAFETTIANLPSNKQLPVEVQKQILKLATSDKDSDRDKALSTVIALINAPMGKGMGVDERGKIIGQIVTLLDNDELKSDTKFLQDLFQVCTCDDASNPISVAALINKGWSVTKIIKLQEAGKSVDAVALSDHREKLHALMEKDLDLVILITEVCHLFAGAQGYRFNKEKFIDRLAPVAASVSTKELTSLLEELKSALEPTKDGQIIDLKSEEFEVARTLRLI